MRPFSHAAGETCIPESAERIVTLQDQNALLPLLELGVRPVGSAGDIQHDGARVFRRVDGYDTEGIEFVGSYRRPDPEAVAALRPDLIVASPSLDGAHETFSAIAPTVIIDVFDQPLEEALMRFADLVGRTDTAERLRADTEAHAEAWRARLGEWRERTTVSAVTRVGDGSTFSALEPVQAWGAVRRLLDPAMSPPEREWRNDGLAKSFETLGEHAADVIAFVSFDADDGGSSHAFDRFAAEPLVQALPAARAGQLVHFDGSRMVGASWGKIRSGLDEIGAVLADEDLDRDLVRE